jgi:hypothetical protein
MVLLGIAGLWPKRPQPVVDWRAVFLANNRGIGFMEQYHFQEAQAAFEEVVRLAPDWLPGRINLGIALMNQGGFQPPSLQQALDTFTEILVRDTDNLPAHYCLGILSRHLRDPRPAIDHFVAVLRGDPGDASSWYFLGSLLDADPPRQEECYKKALELQPAMACSAYALGVRLHLQGRDGRALLEQFMRLDDTGTSYLGGGLRYGEMGRYAEVLAPPAPVGSGAIGSLPQFVPRELVVQLAPGARWAAAADFGPDVVGKVQSRVRSRFGATTVVLDYDDDGRPDLFLAGAVVEKGQVRDLLLHNEGAGRFTDVTAAAGLAKPHPTLGCCAADWDNDGKPDLLLTGAGSQLLFRNKGHGTFEDVTVKAGLEKVKSVCLGAAFLDLDQDGDLDLLLAEYAPNPEAALAALSGGKADGSVLILRNTGEVPATRPDVPPPPLSGRFDRVLGLPPFHDVTAPFTGLAVLDFDRDGDLDLLPLADGMSPTLVINDRLERFRRQILAEDAAAWNGALVLDIDHDGLSDLLLLPAGKPPRLLLNCVRPGDKDAGRWFLASTVGNSPLVHAVAVDIDLDGWTDVVGLSAGRVPVLLHNEGGKLVVQPDAFGSDAAWPRDLVAVTVCDALGHGLPDLVLWSESRGLQVAEHRGNGNQALRLVLQGRNLIDSLGNRLRCNADGVGAWVTAHAGTHWAGQENTTLSAGLAQSRQPLLLGLGRSWRADLLRVRWPDGSRQAELDEWPGPPIKLLQQSHRIAW